MTPEKEFVSASSGIAQLDQNLFEVAFEKKSEDGIQIQLDWGLRPIVYGAVRKLRKHNGVLSRSEKDNFCKFLVLKGGT